MSPSRRSIGSTASPRRCSGSSPMAGDAGGRCRSESARSPCGTAAGWSARCARASTPSTSRQAPCRCWPASARPTRARASTTARWTGRAASWPARWTRARPIRYAASTGSTQAPASANSTATSSAPTDPAGASTAVRSTSPTRRASSSTPTITTRPRAASLTAASSPTSRRSASAATLMAPRWTPRAMSGAARSIADGCCALRRTGRSTAPSGCRSKAPPR